MQETFYAFLNKAFDIEACCLQKGEDILLDMTIKIKHAVLWIRGIWFIMFISCGNTG